MASTIAGNGTEMSTATANDIDAMGTATMHPEDTTGMFHIEDGHVHSCNGTCPGGEHWTTLNHAVNALLKNKVSSTTGPVTVHHAPASTSQYRPVKQNVTADNEWRYQYDTLPCPPIVGMDGEPSVVNRVYEVDMTGFDAGDMAMHTLWLAHVDRDPESIINATCQVMDWANGIVDGVQHPLAFIGNKPGDAFAPDYDDTRILIVEPKLQRLAADMYCGGWSKLQREIENRWIIPSLSRYISPTYRVSEHERMDTIVDLLSNPLVYLESTRMALLMMKNAMNGASINRINAFISTYFTTSMDADFQYLVRGFNNAFNPEYRNEWPAGVQFYQNTDGFMRMAADVNPVRLRPNVTESGMRAGYSTAVPPIDVGLAYAAKWSKPIMNESESFHDAAWQLASSVWCNPEGMLRDWDRPADHSFAQSGAWTNFNNQMTTALQWFMWAYSDMETREWIINTPDAYLDSWRQMPMTGKMERLHNLLRYMPGDDGLPHAQVTADGRYFDYRSRIGRLFWDMPSLNDPYGINVDADNEGAGNSWAVHSLG